MKTRISRTTQKYGIEIPTNVSHAHKIDSKSNTLWRDDIDLEIHNDGVVFEMLEEATRDPPR